MVGQSFSRMEWDAFIQINVVFGFFGQILSYKYICHLFTRSNKNNNKVTGTKIKVHRKLDSD